MKKVLLMRVSDEGQTGSTDPLKALRIDVATTAC
jgi:hypothetical protein